MQIGDIIEGGYTAEQSEALAKLGENGAHWEELPPRTEAHPRRVIRRWKIVANAPQPKPTPEEEAAAKKMQRFYEIDVASVRPLRALAAGTATEEDKKRLAALEAEATELRKQ